MNIEEKSVPPVEEGARELVWLDPQSVEESRIVGRARGRGGVEFERVEVGAAWFIRRTHWVSSSRKTVHETEHTEAHDDVMRDWADLLAGRAR